MTAPGNTPATDDLCARLGHSLREHRARIATRDEAADQSARIALEARGLIVLDGPHLTLTDNGRTCAQETT